MVKRLRFIHLFGLVILLFFASVHLAWGQSDMMEDVDLEENDSVFVSILTCAPGSEAYDLYGHTALRICDMRQDFDRVYNYGIYNFSQPNFTWRFILGETDYMMIGIPIRNFLYSYAAEGRSVTEQVLHLTPEQKGLVAKVVFENANTPNWTYRYRYSDDNCTTRVVDAVLQAIEKSGSKVVLPDTLQPTTRRTMIRRFAGVFPWTEFSDDLLMGAELDKEISGTQQLFLPLCAAEILQGIVVQDTQGECYPLVSKCRVLVDCPPLQAKQMVVMPYMYCAAACLLVLALTVYEWKKRKNFVLLDVALLLPQGLAGCIIAFLFFFSQHPGMDSNWLVLLLNPLPLLLLPFVVRSQKRGTRFARYFYAVNGDVCLILAVIAAVGIQSFPRGFLFLAGCLLIRSLRHVLPALKNKETKGIDIH